jgi:hypothetical protein
MRAQGGSGAPSGSEGFNGFEYPREVNIHPKTVRSPCGLREMGLSESMPVRIAVEMAQAREIGLRIAGTGFRAQKGSQRVDHR